jgi:DNA-3-methyladenine glycosylase I
MIRQRRRQQLGTQASAPASLHNCLAVLSLAAVARFFSYDFRSTIASMKKRCPWPGEDPLYVAYHDEEWGVPSHDDRHLFELLNLEGAQAGLSWITILRKRENYRKAFADWNAKIIAGFGPRESVRLMANPGIVRNRLKISATIDNAKAFLKVREEFGSFDRYLWRFVNGTPLKNRRRSFGDVPASTKESDALSRDLKQRGFRFVGTTICYAFMQATGMVNDHLTTCFRHRELGTQASAPAS